MKLLPTSDTFIGTLVKVIVDDYAREQSKAKEVTRHDGTREIIGGGDPEKYGLKVVRVLAGGDGEEQGQPYFKGIKIGDHVMLQRHEGETIEFEGEKFIIGSWHSILARIAE